MAIFDFDGTLYEKETFQVLMKHLKNHPVYHTNFNSFMRWMVPRFVGYKLNVYPSEKMKERSMQKYLDAINSMSKKELNIFFEDIADKMKDDLNPLVINKLKQHIKDGIHVMVVSGTYLNLLQVVLEDYHFDDIIGSKIPFNGQQVDKEKTIYHINGTRKNDKINEALVDTKVDWENSFAYGDSLSDLSVLELVGHPVAVQPEKKLRKVAEERNWEIL